MCTMMNAIYAQELKKIYVHKVSDGIENTVQLECSKVIFYFSHKPKIERTTAYDSEHKGWQTERYFFAVDSIDKFCDAEMKTEPQSDYYHIRFTQSTSPQKGFMVEFSYDPQRVMLVHESFNAITHDKGELFRFIDKHVLDSMQYTNNVLLRLAKHDPRRVVIDCGHGGKDTGAVGINACAEKDVTLQVGMETAELLRAKGCDVLLTRSADTFVPLTDRTHMIDLYRPDAYISVHANSAAHAQASGVETYCLASDLFLPIGSNIDKRLMSLLAQRYNESHRLAATVHHALLQALVPYNIFDRQVKHAVAQMLIGTNMPGILVEVGFLTHPVEGLRLADAAYQRRLAQGLSEGLLTYLNT